MQLFALNLKGVHDTLTLEKLMIRVPRRLPLASVIINVEKHVVAMQGVSNVKGNFAKYDIDPDYRCAVIHVHYSQWILRGLT